MQYIEPLLPDQYYHLYNHGVGGRDLFCSKENYEYFLELYDKYISPIAETYAWCLMPNHFHLLVRIKEDVAYKYSNADRSVDAVRFEEHKWETIGIHDLSACAAPDSVIKRTDIKIPQPQLHFSHLFNAYTKYLNQFSGQHGALFQRPFQRKLIDSENYLKQVILYIHNNPVHHGFCELSADYGWSSYLTCTSDKATKLLRTEVLEWFGDANNFIFAHKASLDFDDIDRWLEVSV